MEITMTNRTKIYCNYCKGQTNHEIKAVHHTYHQEEHEINGILYLEPIEESEWSFLVCCGCDAPTMEGKINDCGQEYENIYYPERKILHKRQKKAFRHLDRNLKKIYQEVFLAFEQELMIVTAMGIRALLEGICVSQGIDDQKGRSLHNKIEKLKELPQIPESIIDSLHQIKFIGNEAAHRLDHSDKDSLTKALDLLEALIFHLYEAPKNLEEKSRKLSN